MRVRSNEELGVFTVLGSASIHSVHFSKPHEHQNFSQDCPSMTEKVLLASRD